MKKVAILIDGGCLRVAVRRARKGFTPDYVEKVAHLCKQCDEEIFRILYYDCKPFSGNIKLPISGNTVTKSSNDAWFSDLARKPLFATRMGVLKFRGFVLKYEPGSIPNRPLVDSDFVEKLEQKGVDMRIGLDMAILSNNRSVDRVTLLSNDTDCIPAMKHVRRSGIQLSLVKMPNFNLTPELLPHCDFVHHLATWPTN